MANNITAILVSGYQSYFNFQTGFEPDANIVSAEVVGVGISGSDLDVTFKDGSQVLVNFDGPTSDFTVSADAAGNDVDFTSSVPVAIYVLGPGQTIDTPQQYLVQLGSAPSFSGSLTDPNFLTSFMTGATNEQSPGLIETAQTLECYGTSSTLTGNDGNDTFIDNTGGYFAMYGDSPDGNDPGSNTFIFAANVVPTETTSSGIGVINTYGNSIIYGTNSFAPTIAGGDIDAIQSSGTNDFSATNIFQINELAFGSAGEMIFAWGQFVSGGSGGGDTLYLEAHSLYAGTSATSLDLSKLNFTNWTSTDQLILAGTTQQGSTTDTINLPNVAAELMLNMESGTVNGGTGSDTIIGGSGTVTINGGKGANQIQLGSGTTDLLSNGTDTIGGATGSATVTASGDPLYFGSSGGTVFNAQAAGTIIGGTGGNTVTGGAGNLLVFGVSALTYTGGAGGATLIGGGAGNTVTGGAGTLLAFASGNMTYTGTGGAATVIGGGGALNAALGTGGGIAYGGPGGGDTLSTASGTQSILVGGGAGDVLTATGSGADILVAGGGAETINASAATGNLVIFGGPGSDVLSGGTGNDLFVAEPGSETLTGGGGTNSYVFIDFGKSSRTDVITDFNPNRDAIGLFGYGGEPGADTAALASATTANGITTISLTDGTTIQLLGAPTLHSYNFF
jgi:Ca2+-binding RTX toxin-like protein